MTTTTKFASIALWAKAVGSSAKTRTGQRKAILASFKPLSGLSAKFNPSSWDACFGRSTTRTAYYARQQRTRQEAFAANHPLTLSMPAPAQYQAIYGPFTYAVETSISELSGFVNHVRIGDWIIRLSEVVSWDNSRYSKSWHNSHGGVKVVEARTVMIRRVAADGTMESKDVAVDAWRGNFLLNALVQSGIVEAHKGKMNIRLHPAFDVKTVREGSLSVYERTLAGQTYDYCVVWHGITFHAPTVKAAIKGLRTKLHSVISAKNAPITWELGKKLGFCDEGMKQFARDFNLDTKARYSAQQIEDAVRSNIAAAAPYRSELCKLAEAVGVNIAECA